MDNEPRRLSPRGMALYSVAAIGGGFFYIFNNAVLPLLLSRLTGNVLLLNLMSNTRSIEGAVIQPVVGAWSDRIWTRLGRRRPFMLIAMPLCALFVALGLFGKRIPLVAYPIVAAVILLTFLITIVGVPERREDVHLEPRHRLGEYLAALQGHRQALRYLVALFLYNVGINTIMVNLTRFARHELGTSKSGAV